MTVPVVLVAGMHGPARAAVVDRLLREHANAVALHHDLRGITAGRIVRVVRDSRRVVEHTEIDLAHGCVSCTVREDLIPQLLRYAVTASLLVVDLWDCVEPRMVADALGHAEESVDRFRLTGVLTALDAEHTPSDLCRGDLLTEAGKAGSAGDPRYVAEVLARQIEYATGLVLPELMPAPLPGVPEEDLDLCREILSHLAPATPVSATADPLPRVTGPALCTRELALRVDPATALLPCDTHTDAVDTIVWRARRPLHPARFFDAADALASETVRSRGRFWLANRPDRMIAWDAIAGVVGIADAGAWLAALPSDAWNELPPARTLAADLDWCIEHGDRVQHLVFTGPDLDRVRIHRLLDACLLGPGESPEPDDDPFTAFLDLRRPYEPPA
ncbi:CobW family GTP-binding protein [Actinocorallia sp. A-T 12471]|uniref:CobW family GTP-binding protein n=1 Tax=Actinocorallia sp. A-T 12471 TaxID=3089813 RepID=UPI0029D37E20|nr:GTP-binding protein [Actinocorallia sp. A-T 12471]MDX6741450.1 GTP-binding protein [Actinocorallia sp. A-T 12471]